MVEADFPRLLASQAASRLRTMEAQQAASRDARVEVAYAAAKAGFDGHLAAVERGAH